MWNNKAAQMEPITPHWSWVPCFSVLYVSLFVRCIVCVCVCVCVPRELTQTAYSMQSTQWHTRQRNAAETSQKKLCDDIFMSSLPHSCSLHTVSLTFYAYTKHVYLIQCMFLKSEQGESCEERDYLCRNIFILCTWARIVHICIALFQTWAYGV